MYIIYIKNFARTNKSNNRKNTSQRKLSVHNKQNFNVNIYTYKYKKSVS